MNNSMWIKLICIKNCNSMSSVNHQVYNAFKGKIFYTFNIEDNPMVSLYDTIGWAGFFEKKWFLTETQYREQRINKILEKD